MNRSILIYWYLPLSLEWKVSIRTHHHCLKEALAIRLRSSVHVVVGSAEAVKCVGHLPDGNRFNSVRRGG